VVCIYVLSIAQHQLFWQQCCISFKSWHVHDDRFTKKDFCLTAMQQIAIHAPRCTIFLYHYHAYHYFTYYYKVCRSRWSRALRRGSAAARLLGLRVRNPQGAGISAYSECCLLSSGYLRIGLISRAEEFYRMRCVCKWSQNLNSVKAEAYWAVELWKIMFTCSVNIYDLRLCTSLFRTQQLLQYHNV